MSDHASQEPFDYGMLDEQTREIVLRKTDETHGLIMRTAESIIAIGENLPAVQRYLPDMKFSAWLRAEFDLSRQSAYNFMKVATRLGGSCDDSPRPQGGGFWNEAGVSSHTVRSVHATSASKAHNNFCLAWYGFGTRSCFYPRPFAVEPIKTRFS